MNDNELLRKSNIKVFSDFLDSLLLCDVDAVAELWTNDGVLEFPFAPENHPTKVEGKEQIKSYFVEAFKHKKPIKYLDRVTYPMVDPNNLYVEFNGELEALETKEKYRNHYCALVKFRDDKISLFREYFDSAVRTTHESSWR